MQNARRGSPVNDASTAPAGQAHASAVPDPAAQLQRALCELAAITQALTTSRQEAQAAREHLRTLTEINSQLNRELIQLAHTEAQVRAFAYHDELTGLPNRRLLLDRLKQVLAQSARHDKQAVLLMLDLDGFKVVNDRLGHAAGDKLLQAVAKRLMSGVRGADTVCRYGGDEFLILLPEVDNPGMAAAVWKKLKSAMDKPYLIDGYRVCLTTSMGSVVYPTDGQTDVALIQRADEALYRAKARSAIALIEALPRETGPRADTRYPAGSEQPGEWRNDDPESLRDSIPVDAHHRVDR